MPNTLDFTSVESVSKNDRVTCPFKDPMEAKTYNPDDVCPVCGATGDLTDENEELMNKYCPTD